MLPDRYCDFLLNLYTEGRSELPSENKTGFFKKNLLSLALLLMLSLSLFLFYFTELSFILQIVFIIIFTASSGISGVYIVKKSGAELIPLLAAALILFIATVQAALILFPDQPSILSSVMALNCLLWLYYGGKWNVISFKISGLAGLLVIVITILL